MKKKILSKVLLKVQEEIIKLNYQTPQKKQRSMAQYSNIRLLLCME